MKQDFRERESHKLVRYERPTQVQTGREKRRERRKKNRIKLGY